MPSPYFSQPDRIRRVTGYVIPVGNGAVGKSCLGIILRNLSNLEPAYEKLARVNKSMNMEFEFIVDRLEVDRKRFLVTQQFLIPPGQKASEEDVTGRSFEQVMDIYRFMIRRVDVVLLAYSITDLNSFQDLEFWIKKIQPYTTKYTSFIIVGTHLDQNHRREVTEQNLYKGTTYIGKQIKSRHEDWCGHCVGLEVSNTQGTNLLELKHKISMGILQASFFA